MALVSPPLRSHTLSGASLSALAFALLTSVDTIFKLLASGHPAFQIMLVNGCFALMPILAWTLMTGGISRLVTLRLPQHLARGSVSVMSGFAAIYAYARLPLVDFYAIVFAGPLIVTALSAFWLGEKVEKARWFAIIIGFAGIIIIANPFAAHATGDLPHHVAVAGRFAALISVFCYALSVVMIRRMRLGESNLSFSFYGYVASITICGAIFWWHGGPMLTTHDIAHLALSGTLGGISSICLMTAYHRSPVAIVAPFQYTQIIWGAVAGYFLWAQLPDINLVLGAVLVASSGFFVIYREFRTQAVA